MAKMSMSESRWQTTVGELIVALTDEARDAAVEEAKTFKVVASIVNELLRCQRRMQPRKLGR